MAAGRALPFFATTEAGQIRCWRLGGGGDLAILTSPCAAASVEAERVAALCPSWRVTAIELPGLGGSAGCSPTDPDAIARAVSEAMDRSGIDACVLVAIDLAAALVAPLCRYRSRQPERIVLVGSQAAAAWIRMGISPPDLAPRPDGSHLTALWAFLRDRHVLDPADPSLAAGDGEPIPSPAELDAAFVAACVRPDRFGRLWSALVASGMPTEASLVRIERLHDLPAALADLALPAGARDAEPSRALPGGRIWHDEVATARGRMHLRRAGGEGRPLLVIPTGGGSSAQFAPVVQGLARGRLAFSVDYLGNGLSAKREGAVSIGDLAEDMAALLDAMGLPEVDVWGSHTGAVVGLELAIRYPENVGRLIMEGPVFVAPDFQQDLLARYFPAIHPDKWGLHLPLVWNWRRDGFLFWPWYRDARGSARRLGLPSPHALHDYVVGILESGPTYDGAYRAAFGYDTRARLPLLTRPALVCAGPNDMLANALSETRTLGLADVEVRETPTTVWWPDPDPDEAAATLAIYEAFLAA